MQGFSFGLLVDIGHDGPVAGAVPYPRGDAGWRLFGLRRVGSALLSLGGRHDALSAPGDASGSAPASRRDASGAASPRR